MHADNAAEVTAPDGSAVHPLCADSRDEFTSLEVGVCLTIPLGTTFQFRAGHDGLRAVAVTIPPWPADQDEARLEHGVW